VIDVPFLIRGGGVLLFGWAALMDWRHRRVQNHVWGLIATLGVIALAFRSTVPGTLTQGVEGAMWVWIGTAIAGVWYTGILHDEGEDHIPFLVPMFAGILSLFAIALFVI